MEIERLKGIIARQEIDIKNLRKVNGDKETSYYDYVILEAKF